jgi:hypothetical protein
MWPVLVIVCLLILWGASLYWRWQTLRRQAPEIFAAKREAGELASHVDQAAFSAAYLHHEGPRAETHAFVAGLITGLGLAPYVTAFNGAWRILWRAMGAPPVYETGTMLHTFFLFIGILGFILLTGVIVMRRYYRTPVSNFRRAIDQLNKAG